MRLGWAPSRRAARELIESRLVRVNGRPYPKGGTVTAGDRVEVEPAAGKAILADPNLLIEVLYEDRSMLVINKPGLMPCYPLRADETGTVMNGVVARFPETATSGENPLEGGLVHRLDNGTSGALLIARDTTGHSALRDALRAGAISRNYLALVSGRIDVSTRFSESIGHHKSSRAKMVVAAESTTKTRGTPRRASTLVEPVRVLRRFTLLRVIPDTGVRHQIRVHLASAGFPIAGDQLYGGAAVPNLAPGRFFLHLERLALESPATGQIEVVAPLPNDLSTVLDAID